MAVYPVYYSHTPDVQRAEPAYVEHFPWGKDERRPFTIARVLWLDDGLFVHMQTDARPRHMEARGLNETVYVENCMEFFLMPDPGHSSAYINFEFNPAAALFISLGEQREDRRLLEPADYRTLFSVKPALYAWGWEISYTIPFSFLKAYFPAFQAQDGHEMRGNFYELCEKVAPPHYACWSYVVSAVPDYHRPECFGTLRLVREGR